MFGAFYFVFVVVFVGIRTDVDVNCYLSHVGVKSLVTEVSITAMSC